MSCCCKPSRQWTPWSDCDSSSPTILTWNQFILFLSKVKIFSRLDHFLCKWNWKDCNHWRPYFRLHKFVKNDSKLLGLGSNDKNLFLEKQYIQDYTGRHLGNSLHWQLYRLNYPDDRLCLSIFHFVVVDFLLIKRRFICSFTTHWPDFGEYMQIIFRITMTWMVKIFIILEINQVLLISYPRTCFIWIVFPEILKLVQTY